MIRGHPTPARAAATGDLVDLSTPRLPLLSAAAVILIGYLLFFGRGIVRAVQVNQTGEVLPPLDYGSYLGAMEVTVRLAQIGGAILILILVCRWLDIPAPLAGIPRRPAAAEPALASTGLMVAGTVAGGLLLQVLTGGADDPNAAAGGVVGNGWALLSLIGAVSAGVVEEIIVVALPVLIGRRAGWPPLVIVLVSAVLLRWPFHIYHGLVVSLPWTFVWGGATAIAFLYLRRLLPLITVHALYDAQIEMYSAYGDPGRLVVIGTGLVLLLYLVVGLVAGRRARRHPGTARPSAQVARFMIARFDRTLLIVVVLVVLAAAGVLVIQVQQAPDQVTAVTAVAAVAAAAVVVITATGVGLASWVTSNWIVRRDVAGRVTAVVRWHTSYTGDNVLDSAVGVDDLTAAASIAEVDGRDIVLATTRARRRMLADHSITHRTSGVLRRLRMAAADLRRPDTTTTGGSGDLTAGEPAG